MVAAADSNVVTAGADIQCMDGVRMEGVLVVHIDGAQQD